MQKLFLSLLLLAASEFPLFAETDVPPPGFKMAFIGDQGLGPGAQKVLELVKGEGADLLVHLGDFDYSDNPAAWAGQYDRILGGDFPIISVVGNHDLLSWRGTRGYAWYVSERLRRMGVEVHGDPGERCSFRYRGVFFVLTAPGLIGTGHAEFIRRELDADSSIWRISAWHVNQRLMQVGSKGDEAGWDVYEESRKGGAIIATAHEHSYSRTHLLSGMSARTVASTSDTLRLRKGRTFAFVSGLGGEEVRPQLLSGDWWAKIYTATQQALPGALFATFHVDGDPRKAEFAFKAVDGTVADHFIVYRGEDTVPPPPPPPPPPIPRPVEGPGNGGRRLEIDPAKLGVGTGGRLTLLDLHGRILARVEKADGPVSLPMPGCGMAILRMEWRGGSSQRKIVIFP
jgi:hypothetical protein